MTAVSTSWAALAILSQSGLSGSNKAGSAADAILDIVSGRKTAGATGLVNTQAAKTATASTAATTPREAGGSVSSEISKAKSSAMNAAAINSLQYSNYPDDMKPPEASAENARGLAERLAEDVKYYNAQFNLRKIPSREEHMALKDTWLANEIATGASEKQIKTGLEMNWGEGGYERNVDWATQYNKSTMETATMAAGAIGTIRDVFQQIFNQDIKISFADDGRMSVEAFEITNGDQKMLSYDENGKITAFS